MRKLSAILIVLLLATLLANVSVADGPSPSVGDGGSGEGAAGIAIAPGTLWANGAWDDVNGLASEQDTAVEAARTADDFLLDGGCPLYEVTEIRGTLYTDSAEPSAAIVEIYADSGGGGPLDPPLFTFPDNGYIDLGPSQFPWPVREYTFPTPGLTLAPGKYWVSVVGLGDGSYVDQAFFATSANGVNIQLQEGYWKSAWFGWPTWTPTSVVFGQQYDLAFDIDGHCAGPPPMYVANVKIIPIPGPLPRLQGVVRMVTKPGQPVGGALVDVEWSKPADLPVVVPKTARTNCWGRAYTYVRHPAAGTYQLCVVDATHPDYVYDPSLNLVTCAWYTQP